ncbi:hypothetical protein L208DRAFT_1390816 [Tricholoma matsutake]|nr:hypothetical protein L208DRAFT_1390816 [Tricholoma matsutake 945]
MSRRAWVQSPVWSSFLFNIMICCEFMGVETSYRKCDVLLCYVHCGGQVDITAASIWTLLAKVFISKNTSRAQKRRNNIRP